MGTELAVAGALSLLGTGLNAYNQRQTVKAQDNQLAKQIRQQSARQGQADTAVNELLTQRATTDGSAERGASSNQYLQQLQATQASANRGLGQAGAVSDAYRTAANDAALGVSDYGTTAANLMARMDAPQRQRQRESLENSNLQTRLGLIGRQASSDDYLSRLRLQSIRENPWLSAAAQAANGAAMGVATNGIGAADRTAGLSAQANNITAANNARLFDRLQGTWG